MTFSFSHRVYLCSNQYQKMEACSFEGWGNVRRDDVIHSCGFKVTVFISPAQTFCGVLASIFKCLHEQFSQYFKFNFSEIKLLLPASSPNLLLLLPQPLTPNLFLSQTPLSKLMAILSILPKLWDTSHPWPKLFPPLPHAIPCLFLYLKHIFNLSFLFLYSLSNPSPQYFT